MQKSNAYEKLRNQVQKTKEPQTPKKEKPDKKRIKEEKKALKEDVKQKKEVKKTREYQKTVKETIKTTQKKREEENKKTTGIETIKNMSARSRRRSIIFAIIIGYICFLIYGVVNSDFVTNEAGVSMPVAKTNREVKEMEEYKLVKSYYIRAQKQYKKILDIDIELSQNPNTSKLIATKYEKELAFFDAFITDLQAIKVGDEYTIVLDQLISWCSNDICVYLQNMSAALSQNNQEKASNALEDRGRTIVDFNTISENLTAIGNSIKGADTIEMDFNPEEYTKGGDNNGQNR